MDINVRGVPGETWLEFRSWAVRRGTPVGTLLAEALREWLERQAALQDRKEPA